MHIIVEYHDENMPRLKQRKCGDWIDLYCTKAEILNRLYRPKNNNPDVFHFRKYDEIVINFGISVGFPMDYEIHIIPKWDIFYSNGLMAQNSVSVIPSYYCNSDDYWMMHCVCLREYATMKKYAKVAQFRLMKRMHEIQIHEVKTEELGERNA